MLQVIVTDQSEIDVKNDILASFWTFRFVKNTDAFPSVTNKNVKSIYCIFCPKNINQFD